MINKTLLTPAIIKKVRVPGALTNKSASIVLAKRDISMHQYQLKRRSSEGSKVREAIRAAKELIQKSELLKREIAKNATNQITPKISDFQKVVAQVVIGCDESSVQDSSLRNDFNEYRDILQSHTENYSDDGFTSSAMESLNVSNTIQE